MTPTLVVLRVDGHGVEHLSLHAKREQAHRRLVEVGRKAWRDRFDYDLPVEERLLDAGQRVSDRLVAEGWRVRVEGLEVEL